MEVGESLLDVVHREAWEEARAKLRDTTAFGLSSDPISERHTYPNGDIVQNISLLAHGYLVNADYAPDFSEVSEIRFARFDEICRKEFVQTEYPTFFHWKAYRDTGVFQFV